MANILIEVFCLFALCFIMNVLSYLFFYDKRFCDIEDTLDDVMDKFLDHDEKFNGIDRSLGDMEDRISTHIHVMNENVTKCVSGLFDHVNENYTHKEYVDGLVDKTYNELVRGKCQQD